MRFIIYGAGGIGGPLGAFLQEAGAETVLIARGEHLKRMQAGGLTVIAEGGARTIPSPPWGILPSWSRGPETWLR